MACVLALPPAGRALIDSYASGFYTRGVDAASYLDQGGAVLDPFYLPAREFALVPRISLAVMQEDNVFLDPPDDAEAGTSINLAPGFLGIWGRPSGNHLYTDYGLVLPIYQSVDELDDGPSHLLRVGGLYLTGKSQIQAELGYRQLAEAVDTVVGARVTKQDYIADLNLEHQISGKSSAGVEGRVERNDYDLEEYSDYNRYYGAARLYHRATPKSQVFAQGGIGRDDPLDDKDADLAADFYDLSLGVRGKQSPKFNSSGRVGYMWRDYDANQRANYGNWIASLRAESTPFGLTTFGGEIYSDIRPAIDDDQTDVIDQGVVFSASRRMFIERVRGNATATLGQIDYSGAQSSDPETAQTEGGIPDGRNDLYWGFSLGADWWTRERFSVGLAYSYINRDGSRGADPVTQEETSYEYGRWTLRTSWNY
jgi:hypothetical protein